PPADGLLQLLPRRRVVHDRDRLLASCWYSDENHTPSPPLLHAHRRCGDDCSFDSRAVALRRTTPSSTSRVRSRRSSVCVVLDASVPARRAMELARRADVLAARKDRAAVDIRSAATLAGDGTLRAVR